MVRCEGVCLHRKYWQCAGGEKGELEFDYLHSHYFSLLIPYLYYKEDSRAHYIKFFKYMRYGMGDDSASEFLAGQA